MQKVEPWPDSLTSSICPSIKFTSFWQIASPSPVPPYRRAVLTLSCW